MNRRVAGVAAVPIVFALDLHRLEHGGQAGRGHHGPRAQAPAGKHLGLAGADLGGQHKHLERLEGGQPVEVDLPLQKVLQRVDVQRIGLVGRKRVGPEAGQGVTHHLPGRGVSGQRGHAAKQQVKGHTLGIGDLGLQSAHGDHAVPKSL